jgi:hypothetical protein
MLKKCITITFAFHRIFYTFMLNVCNLKHQPQFSKLTFFIVGQCPVSPSFS